MIRILGAVLALLLLSSCGVKNDLVLPDGSKTAKTEKDPSKPPQPIGQ